MTNTPSVNNLYKNNDQYNPNNNSYINDDKPVMSLANTQGYVNTNKRYSNSNSKNSNSYNYNNLNRSYISPSSNDR